jgi:hypothetical protein
MLGVIFFRYIIAQRRQEKKKKEGAGYGKNCVKDYSEPNKVIYRGH